MMHGKWRKYSCFTNGVMVACMVLAAGCGSPEVVDVDDVAEDGTDTDSRNEGPTDSGAETAGNGIAQLSSMPIASPALLNLVDGFDYGIWGYSEEAVFHLKDGEWMSENLHAETSVTMLCVRPDGHLWAVGEQGVQGVLMTGPATDLKLVFAIPRTDAGLVARIRDIHCAADGSLVMAGSYEVEESDADEPPTESLLARYDGNTYTNYAVGEEIRLWALWSDDETTVAAGDDGAIVTLEGDSISFTGVGEDSLLTHIAGRSAADLFVTTFEGLILHFDGTVWTSMTLESDARLLINDLAVSDDAVYLTGEPAWGEPEIPYSVFSLESDGVFRPLAVQPKGEITQVLFSAGRLYGAGYLGGAVITGYDGDVWQDEMFRINLNGTMDAVATNGEGVIVGAGSRGVARFDGTSWRVLAADDATYTDVVSFNDNRFIVSNGNYNADIQPLALVDGDTMTPVDGFDNIKAHIYTMSRCPNGDIWAAGKRSDTLVDEEAPPPVTPYAAHWNGTVWTEYSPTLSSGTAFYSVACSDAQVYLGSGATLLRFENNEWQELPESSVDDYGALLAVSADNVFVGRSPISFWNGEAFSKITPLEGLRAFDFAVDESGTVLMAGDSGLETEDEKKALLMILYNDEWQTVIQNDTSFFRSVAASGKAFVATDSEHVWWGSLE